MQDAKWDHRRHSFARTRYLAKLLRIFYRCRENRKMMWLRSDRSMRTSAERSSTNMVYGSRSVMNACTTGYEVRFGECERAEGGQVCSRQTRWMCWMFAYRVTTRSTPPRVDSDLRTRALNEIWHAPLVARRRWGTPIVTLCTRQTPLIFLSFIAFVIVRSLTYPIFLSSLRTPFCLYRPTSGLANRVQRSLLR